MSGPLQGIRVIECAGYLSAPAACYMLGDLGAEIIKIEDRIKGDPVRGMATLFGGSMFLPDGTNIQFETANRNKKGITLDLKKQEGRELLYRLVQKADVFCTNYSLKAIEELGISYETLKKHNPRIIYGLATGYGSKGKENNKRAYDTIAQARSGIMTALGEPDSPPQQIGGAIFDQMTGTLLASGIMGALVAREKQGIGQKVEVSLIDAGIHLQAFNVSMALFRGRPMPRNSRKTLKNPLANHYECADGKWIIFSEAQSDRFWHGFCDCTGIQNLEKDPKFVDANARRTNYRELTDALERVFITKNRDEWISIFEKKGGGIAYSPVLDITELANDPQIIANEGIVDVEHPRLGKMKYVGIPIKYTETKPEIKDFAPGFGQHTEEVLIDVLGMDWDEIGKLKDAEVI